MSAQASIQPDLTAQRERVRDLVMRHGWNATCYQTVNPVFEYRFYPELDAVVAYVRARGERVVAGAPICPPSLIDEVVQRFDEEEKSPALYFGASSRVAEVLGESGVVSVGSQPVWSPRTWNERVLAKASLRYQFRRAAKKGVVVREWSTKEAENSPELRSVLDEWLGLRGLPPLHFLVEPETLDYLKDRRTFVASVEGRPIAFLNLCPVPLRNGWLTEQFPRRAHAPNGTIDLLMHVAAQTVAAEGAEYLTMGLVPLSSHGSHQNPWWMRMASSAARRFGRRFYSFRGLEEFKSKFSPEGWEPIYVASSKGRFRPWDLLAVAEAFSGMSVPKMLATMK